MTFQEANRPAGPGPAAQDEPAPVRAAAYARGLGNLIGTRHGASTRQSLLVGWGIAGVCLLLAIALWPVVSNEDPLSGGYGFMHALYRVLVVGVILGLAIGIRALAVGGQSFYLYSGGIVHTRRSNLRAAAWPDLARIATLHDRRSTGTGVGKVLGYRLELTDGAKISIPLSSAARQGGRDPFIDRLLDAARSHNIPLA